MSDSVGKASLLGLASTYLILPLGIITNVLLARALGPEVKGLFTLFTTTVGFVLLPSYAVQSSLIRYIAFHKPALATAKKVINAAVIGHSALTMGLLMLLVQIETLRRLLLGGVNSLFLWAIVVQVVGALWCFYRAALLSGLQMYSASVLWSTLHNFSTNIITLGFIGFWWLWRVAPTLEWAVASYFVAGFVPGLAIWGLVTARLQAKVENPILPLSMLSAVATFALPILLRGIVEWANYRIDIYFVNWFVGVREVGVYSVAVGLAQQLWTVPFSVATPLFARISDEGDSEGSRETARRAFRVTALVTVVLAASLGVAAPLLIPLLYGAEFADAVPLLWILLPGVAAIGPTRAVSSYLMGSGHPAQVLHAELAGLVATLSLNVLLIPTVGVFGAAIASSIAYLVYSGFLCARFVRHSQSLWRELLPSREDGRYLQERLPVQKIVTKIKNIGSSKPRG